MMIRPAKWLAFVYWRLQQVFKGIYDDGHSEWKAMVIICCTELAAILGLLYIAELVGVRPLVPQSQGMSLIFGITLTSFIVFANQRLLRRNNRWKRYLAEFETYSTAVRSFGTIAIILTIVVVVAISLLAAVKSGQLARSRTLVGYVAGQELHQIS